METGSTSFRPSPWRAHRRAVAGVLPVDHGCDDGIKTVPIPLGTASVTNPNANNVTVKWVTADALSGKTINFELYRVALLAGFRDRSEPERLRWSERRPNVPGGDQHFSGDDLRHSWACTFTDNVQTPSAVTPTQESTARDRDIFRLTASVREGSC